MTDLKNTWVLGEQYAHTDQNAAASAINANTHAQTLTGTYSSIPAAGAGNNGAVFLCTDCDAAYRSNGSAWSKIRVGGYAGPPMADPPTTGWTAANMQSGAAFAQDLDGMLFSSPTVGSTLAFGHQYRTYPGSTFTLTTYQEVDYLAASGISNFNTYFHSGITIWDGTKSVIYGTFNNGAGAVGGWAGSGWNVAGVQLSNNTTHSAFDGSPLLAQTLCKIPNWWRFQDDGTNRIVQYSLNGLQWRTYVTESRTTFLTPTRIGISLSNCGGATGFNRLRSWTGVS